MSDSHIKKIDFIEPFWLSAFIKTLKNDDKNDEKNFDFILKTLSVSKIDFLVTER